MCTYETETIDVRGSGKGGQDWFSVMTATVYFDHPVHATAAEHTLNIDLLNPDKGPGARIAMELDPASAWMLAKAILTMLEEAPVPGLNLSA
jgi:Family of unknown function (DUF6295)